MAVKLVEQRVVHEAVDLDDWSVAEKVVLLVVNWAMNSVVHLDTKLGVTLVQKLGEKLGVLLEI